MMTFHLRLKRINKPKYTRLEFDLEKLKDTSVLETFQAMIGGKFAPLTILNSEDTDLDSMMTTFNTAVTEKQPVRSLANIVRRTKKKKKNRVTAEIPDLCDRRRELRKERFEPEGSEKYNDIKKCMKKTK